MLEFINFSYKSPNGHIDLDARVRGGELEIRLGGLDDTRFCPTDGRNCERWLKALEEEHIEKWRSNYALDTDIGGESWSLDYKREGKRCRHMKGKNAYPENWERFITLINLLIRITDEHEEREEKHPAEKQKFYCPFCSREVNSGECLEISRSAKRINLEVDIPEWVKCELSKKKDICENCENRPC